MRVDDLRHPAGDAPRVMLVDGRHDHQVARPRAGACDLVVKPAGECVLATKALLQVRLAAIPG